MGIFGDFGEIFYNLSVVWGIFLSCEFLGIFFLFFSSFGGFFGVFFTVL